MKYIIFGAGKVGKDALYSLGEENVAFFCDNNRYDCNYLGKAVISFRKAIERISEEYIFVVASELYHKEMEQQLLDNGVKNYIVYQQPKYLPQYYLHGEWKNISLREIFKACNLGQYKRIVIVGVNEYLSTLLTEMVKELNIVNIIGIVTEEENSGEILGIPYVTWDECWDKTDCVVLNVKRDSSQFHEIIEAREHTFDVIDIYESDHYLDVCCHPELEKYKDIHKGKRVFIIGNGPSLRLDDLETLHKNGEICIAFNRVYRAYSQTAWRPTYLAFTDRNAIKMCWKDIYELKEQIILADTFDELPMEHKKNLDIVHMRLHKFYPNYPGFSKDITKGIYMGYSSAYDIGMQFAAYMGVKEIYLIGMDHSIAGNSSDLQNHFVSDYYKENEREEMKNIFFPTREMLTKSFEKAEKYSRQNGFRIYNATRGGLLEVFERVDFDKLFQ